ncbi:hypothetical protein ACOAKC_12225 [Hathewaya histolytica]|uniref:hypothetical protein n=1 Tax=Hathewaya histolytica TaxID=1498 RepID=UPI003B672332
MKKFFFIICLSLSMSLASCSFPKTENSKVKEQKKLANAENCGQNKGAKELKDNSSKKNIIKEGIEEIQESRDNLTSGDSKNANVDLSVFTINKSGDSYSVLDFITCNSDTDSKICFKNFQGVYTIKTLNIGEGKSISLYYKSKVESGKLNVLIQDESYNILKILETNKEENIKIDVPKSGRYIIKLVGDGATKGELILKQK